jgi:hypothetical protein
MRKGILIACFLSVFKILEAQVGIGTQNPDEALDLENSTASEVDFGINNTSSGDPLIHFQISGTSTFTLGVDNSDTDKLKIGTTALETSTVLTIDANGDVGINDTDPVFKLEVDGNINLSSSTNVYRIGSAHGISKPNTRNIYIGEGAGAQNNAGGVDNAFTGYQAGYSNTTGDNNVSIGDVAAYSNQGGGQNVVVGYQAGYSSTTADVSIKLGHQAGYSSTGSELMYIDNSSTSNALIYVSNFTASDDVYINGGLIINEQSGDFDFRVESNNKANMLSSDANNDYVFVGSTNNVTNRQLQVNSTTASAGLATIKHSNDATGTRLSFAKSRGSEASPVIVSDDDNLGTIKFVPRDGTDFNNESATIEGKVDGTPGTDDLPTELRFQTTPDGSATQSIRMVVRSTGKVGIGNTSPVGELDVVGTAATVATFNRSDDGMIIDFQDGGSTAGNITIAGTTVSYNPFTGAHYANSRDSFEFGKVVILNGDNDNFHHCEKSEIMYGINYAQKPNDKRVLGTYASLINPRESFSADNPHLIMSVGNGVIWVTNEGGNIKSGDYLISSSSEGNAMKDNGQYPVSYVCGRAAEKVNWRNVKADKNGDKKILLSVFYESFEIENVSKEIEDLSNAIQEFKNSLYKL